MTGPVDSIRLFRGSCLAIIALAVSFAALGEVMYALKSEFLLDNAQIGVIGGAGLWGMAISQVAFSSLCDLIGMRRLLLLAFAGHVVAVVLFMTAAGFAGLVIAALVLALANGVIEAVCNPLVATLFPTRKAAMLNRLHQWFPGGIVLGGCILWGMEYLGIGWRGRIALILLPAVCYAATIARQTFPPTENASRNLGLGAAARAVASSPLLWLLLLMMSITMSLELGPNRWIPAVLAAGGMSGILVLVLINGVMAIMRGVAGGVLEKVSPPVLLSISCAVAGLGLWWLSGARSPAETIAAALLFAFGISVVWPTMMGFVAERVPRTGALGLGLMAAAGSLAVGLVTAPLLGQIADDHLGVALPRDQTITIARQLMDNGSSELRAEAQRVLNQSPDGRTSAEFLRRASKEALAPANAAAATLLGAAENRSGLLAFRYLVPFAFFVSLVFFLIALIDRRAGGYAQQVARSQSLHEVS